MNCRDVLLKRVQRSERIKYLQAKQRTCHNVHGLRHWLGNKTTLLKIAVDNVILELCDSCDYFASPLLMEKNN